MILAADPRNPAEYFGACGFLEIAAELYPDVSAGWQREGMVVDGLDEASFNGVVSAFAGTRLEADENWDGEDSTRPYSLVNASAKLTIHMHWWERSDGHGNSFWKCFGGRQKSTDAVELLSACAKSVADATPATLLRMSRPLSGRLGFDPRSAWSAIDTGFSPNDLGKRMSTVPTYPFAELLSATAMQRWPFRPTRGGCRYYAWATPLPRALARLRAAVGPGTAYEFTREKRGQGISCFTYSRPIAAAGDAR